MKSDETDGKEKPAKPRRRQELIVQGFIAAHVAEFLANWKLLNEENGTYFRITD